MSQRTNAVRIRLTPEECRLAEAYAQRYGQDVRQWLLDVVLRELRAEAGWPQKAA